MEIAVESASFGPGDAKSGIQVRMLGPLTIVRDGVQLPLPASRKARALLAYLTIAARPVGRSRLCELLWDVPNDPRGELRWCLSKIRKQLGPTDGRRIVTFDDLISLNLADCFVDVLEIAGAAERRIRDARCEAAAGAV